MNLHALSVEECVRLINHEDRAVPLALERAAPDLAAFIAAAEPRFAAGGRLIYVGAGTSGRLGVLDAAEAPPTFQVEFDRVIGVIAGGDAALRRSSEGMEDDPSGAHPALEALNLDRRDTVIGIAAGATTPYVLGALRFARTRATAASPDSSVFGGSPPLTALLVCSPMERPDFVDHLVILETGPEILAGSTRMKAGTATKLALNTISTTLMVRTGRVYQNLMVDLRATNDKLKDRAARVIAALTGLDRAAAIDLLPCAGNSVKTAVVMQRFGLSREAAEACLARAEGRLDVALASQSETT